MAMQLRIESPTGSRLVSLNEAGGTLIAGRDANSNIHLPDPEQRLSRKHLSFRLVVGGVELQVVSATSGAITNHGPIGPGEAATLKAGDHVKVGPYTLTLEHWASSTPDPFASATGLPVATTSSFSDPTGAVVSAFGPSATPTVHPEVEQGYWVGPSRPSQHQSFSGEQFSGQSQVLGPIEGFGAASNEADGADAIDTFLGSAPSKAGSVLDLMGVTAPEAPALGPVLVLPGYRDETFLHPSMLPALEPVYSAEPSEPVGQIQSEEIDWDDLGMTLAGQKPMHAIQLQPEKLLPPSASLSTPRPEFSTPIEAPTDAHEHLVHAPESNAVSINSPGLADGQPGIVSFTDPQAVSGPTLFEIAQSPTSGASRPTSLAEPSATLLQPSSVNASGPALSSATEVAKSPSTLELSHPVDVEAFARGLGISLPDQISAADWEHIGRATRCMVEGLGQLMSARAALKNELRASNKTEMWLRDNNPFKSDMAESERLRQLLFGGKNSTAYMGAERAVREAAEDLLTHNLAILAASRACVEGVVREFHPERLQAVLPKRSKNWLKLAEDAHLWRDYFHYYGKRSAFMADWLERLFDEHFVTAYSRESERLSQQHIPLP